MLDDRPEVLEVVEFQVLLVRIVEDQQEAGFLGLVQLHDAGQQHGSEGGNRGSHRDSLAAATQAVVVDGERGGLPVHAH